MDKEWEKLEKLSAWQVTQVKSKKEVIQEAQQEQRTCPFCYADGHPSPQECGVRAEISEKRKAGLYSEDDSCSYAVFTEQASSASQMTAGKVVDVTARRPGCAGQAVRAVSAYTQVKMGDAPKYWKLPKPECPDIWIHLPKHKEAQIMVQHGGPSRSS